MHSLEQATMRFWDAASVLRHWRHGNEDFFEMTKLGDRITRTGVAMVASDMLRSLASSRIVPLAMRSRDVLRETRDARRNVVMPFAPKGPDAA